MSSVHDLLCPACACVSAPQHGNITAILAAAVTLTCYLMSVLCVYHQPVPCVPLLIKWAMLAGPKHEQHAKPGRPTALPFWQHHLAAQAPQFQRPADHMAGMRDLSGNAPYAAMPVTCNSMLSAAIERYLE